MQQLLIDFLCISLLHFQLDLFLSILQFTHRSSFSKYLICLGECWFVILFVCVSSPALYAPRREEKHRYSSGGLPPHPHPEDLQVPSAAQGTVTHFNKSYSTFWHFNAPDLPHCGGFETCIKVTSCCHQRSQNTSFPSETEVFFYASF